MEYIKVGGSRRALLNENFVVWVNFLVKKGDILKIFVPKGLKLVRTLNYGPKKPKKFAGKRIYEFNSADFYNPDLAVFELKYIDKDIKDIPIKVQYFKNKKLLEETSYITELIMPDIDINIFLGDPKPQKGLINIEIRPNNDIFFLVKEINLKVFDDDTDKELEIKETQMSFEEFIEVIEELPPEVNPDQFIGNILIPRGLSVKVQVEILVYDLLDNDFIFSSNKIPLPKEIDLSKVFQPLAIPNIISPEININ